MISHVATFAAHVLTPLLCRIASDQLAGARRLSTWRAGALSPLPTISLATTAGATPSHSRPSTLWIIIRLVGGVLFSTGVAEPKLFNTLKKFNFVADYSNKSTRLYV